MKNEKLITVGSWLPLFVGFYNTISGGETKMQEYDFEDLQEQVDEKLDENADKITIDSDNIWKYFDQEGEAGRDYAEKFTDEFFREFKEKLAEIGVMNVEFEELISPKQYNYSNDSINAKFTLDVEKFKNWYGQERQTEEFEQMLKDDYTSYDGFMSFYSSENDSSWNPDEVATDSHKLGKIIEHYLRNENRYLEIEFYAMEYFNYDEFWEKINPVIEQHNAIGDARKRAMRKRQKRVLQN